MSIESLFAVIRDAFAEDERQPPPVTLRGGNDIDSYSPPAPHDASLDEVTDEYVARYAFWALPHLDPRSWRHYLPLLMRYALRHPSDPAMVTEALIRSLRPPDRFPPRLGSLTPGQESAVRLFLESISVGVPDDTLRTEAKQALAEWWLPGAWARPTAEELQALRSGPVNYRDVRGQGYRLVVPDALVSSGPRDIPTESRRVEVWSGYVCGDVHMVVAVNAVAHTVRSVAEAVRLYAGFFGISAAPQPVTVPNARGAVRLSVITGDADAAGEQVTLVVAAATDVVALTIRAADREDIRVVIDRIASSFSL